jgi:NarL family two-component system response regulator YdfI
MTRVKVVASSPVVRAGLEALLREDPRFVVLSSGGVPLPGARAQDSTADVVLMEVASANKLATLAQPRHGEGPATVLLADDLGRAELQRILHAGVQAVLRRDATGPEIIAAIEAAAAGLTVLSSDEMDALLPSALETGAAGIIPDEPLSVREQEVLAMMAEGLGNKEIATRLKISEHTVKFHVSSILAKLRAATRGEAVARGIREGLVVI